MSTLKVGGIRGVSASSDAISAMDLTDLLDITPLAVKSIEVTIKSFFIFLNTHNLDWSYN